MIINVLIVDDSSLMRKIIGSVIEKDPMLKVIGFCENGRIAVDTYIKLNTKIDVILMDIEMPEMNGIDALIEIRALDRRIPVIMFSSLTQTGTEATIQALINGASDYVSKPSNLQNLDDSIKVLEELLIPSIKQLTRQRAASLKNHSARQQVNRFLEKKYPSTDYLPENKFSSNSRIEAVCLGISTGGPVALSSLFKHWQQSVSFPLFIVQHMPPKFTEYLADRLSEMGHIQVKEGIDGEIVQPGIAYLAPGGRHMQLKLKNGQVQISINDDPTLNSCRPSVDYLFQSAAAVYKEKLLGVIMTGMGNDGLAGSRHIVELGGSVIAQDEESSVVWGMPSAVVNAGLSDKVMPLSEIALEIDKRAQR